MMFIAAIFVLGELCGMPETVFGVRLAAVCGFLVMAFSELITCLMTGKSFKGGMKFIFPPLLFLLGALTSFSSHRGFAADEALAERLSLHRGKVYVEGEVSLIEDKSGYRLIELSGARIFTGEKTEGDHEASEKLSKKIYIYDYDGKNTGDDRLYPGMRIGFYGKPECFDGASNPGEFDYRMYLKSLDVSLRTDMEGMRVTYDGTAPYFRVMQDIRDRCKAVFDNITDEKDSGIFKALILGYKSDMDETVNELYKTQGIAHILAVSGLHISLVGMIFYNILLKAGAGLSGAGGVSAFFVVSYGIFTGASGSAMRAVIMLIMRFAAAKAGRSYDNLSALSLAAFLLCLAYPYMLLQSGFQLSFTAILAISLFGDTVIRGVELHMRESYVEKRNRSTWKLKAHPRLWKEAFLRCRLSSTEKTLIMGFLIQIFTLPVVLWHFFAFPLYAFFLNLAVIPLMAYVMYSGISGLFAGLFFPAAAPIFIGSGHYILAFYELLCRISESLPFNSIVLGRPGLFSVAVYYVLIFSLSLLFTGLFKPRSKRRIFKSTGNMLLCLLLSLSGCALIFVKPGPLRLQVTAVDVGQGDCFLISFKDADILVDGGSSSDKSAGERILEPMLLSKGITDLDCVIVSHGDADHVNAISYLLEGSDRIRIKKLILPKAAENSREEVYESIRELSEKTGTELLYMNRGDIADIGGEATLSCIYEGNADSREMNEHSGFLMLKYGAFSMLFTGDAPEKEEMRLVKLMRDEGIEREKITVLKAGHHGSDTSTSEKLLEMFDPDYAVLSYGEGNSYGHPHREVTQRLEEAGVKMLETAKSGAVTLVTDGKRLLVIPYKS